MSERLLTAAQICDKLQVSARTLRRIVQDGSLRPIRVRGSIRFRQSEVDAFVASTETDVEIRLPTEGEWPVVIEVAQDLMSRLDASTADLLEVISIWAALPCSDHRWLGYAEDLVRRLNEVLRPQIEPWTRRQPED